jgi:hypothetical protein
MKFRYLNGATEHYGYEFLEGHTVDITDPHVINKTLGNPYFERVEDDDRTTGSEGDEQTGSLRQGGKPRTGRPPKRS